MSLDDFCVVVLFQDLGREKEKVSLYVGICFVDFCDLGLFFISYAVVVGEQEFLKKFGFVRCQVGAIEEQVKESDVVDVYACACVYVFACVQLWINVCVREREAGFDGVIFFKRG